MTNFTPTEGTYFGYIDNRGNTSTGAYGGTAGTTLLSSPISLSAGSILTLKFAFMTNDGAGFNDFAFIQLRDATSGTVVATLANANTSSAGARSVPANGGPAPAISAGVTLTPSSAYFNGLSTGPIGGDSYGPGSFNGGPGGSTGWVTVNYTVPTTGSYRLFFLVSDVGDTSVDSGLAVDEIGLLYDKFFLDDNGRTRMWLNSTTGAWKVEVLLGFYQGTYEGQVPPITRNGALVLPPTPPGTQAVWGYYDPASHRASFTLRMANGGMAFLFDTNTTGQLP